MDIHQLLVAHSRIFQLATNLLTQANQRLKELTIIDPLTGIGNRRLFDQYFSRDWHLAIREKQWITVILCDVDYFKKYNDTYGHQAGDDCLRQVAHLIHNDCKRMTDIVARYGGEEFLVILPGASQADVLEVSEKLRHLIEDTEIRHKEQVIRVTVSLGGTSYPEHDTLDMNALIHIADQKLYQAKELGRNMSIVD